MSIFRPYSFIPKLTIEACALDILLQMQKTHNYLPKFPLDASRVAEFLGLDVVWDTISDDEYGAIAARILPLEKLIEINDRIPQLQGGLGESTIAHEIGHWVLHIDRTEVERQIRLKHRGLAIKVEPLLCRSLESTEGVEWQAQYFAGCLLMPQYYLLQLSQAKNLAKWQHLYQIAEQLGVTISNLVHRLQDLGWIYCDSQQKEIYLLKNH
nr:ImmA/IrrE family metallo-endopeptidase [Stanieria cyanosphaera]